MLQRQKQNLWRISCSVNDRGGNVADDRNTEPENGNAKTTDSVSNYNTDRVEAEQRKTRKVGIERNCDCTEVQKPEAEKTK